MTRTNRLRKAVRPQSRRKRGLVEALRNMKTMGTTMFGVVRIERTAGLAMVLALMLVSLGMLLSAKPAHAKTFTVDITADVSDSDPDDGICDVSITILDYCSLRAAIEQANDLSGEDTINFDIESPGVQTIELYKELPPIISKVTMNGYTQPGSKPNTNAQGATNATLLIQLDGTDAGPFSNGLVVASSGSVVKGLVINRFKDNGIFLGGLNSRVEGNFIGTDPTGTIDLGNAASGVAIPNPSNTVGGTTPQTRNLISGNDDGVRISDTDGNKVQGNLIGTTKSATDDLGNSDYGVVISAVAIPANDNTIGGSASARNTIAFNGNDGVAVLDSGYGNRISFNSIYSNAGLGIDLGFDGATPNDAKDPDGGPNQLQNKPIVTSAKPTQKNKKKLTSIQGTLNSTPNKSFTVQLFYNPPATSEGKTLIANRSVKTNANGNASFGVSVSRTKAPVGSAVTATAIEAQGNTSEFSAPRTVN